MGTSMGCMHALVWGEAYPDFMQALMPLACLPVEIAGRNRMWRRAAVEGIRQDPAWQGGNYTTQPVQGLRTAVSLLQVAGFAPLYLQRAYPDRESAEGLYRRADRPRPPDPRCQRPDLSARGLAQLRPASAPRRIVTPMTWVNSGDDFINPPDYGIAEETARQMPSVRYILIRATTETRGHGTHTWARFWRQELIDLLARTEGRLSVARLLRAHMVERDDPAAVDFAHQSGVDAVLRIERSLEPVAADQLGRVGAQHLDPDV